MTQHSNIGTSRRDDSPCIRESHFPSFGTSNDTSFGDERVGKSGFSVVYMGNDRHVTDVGGFVHQGT